MAPTGSLPQKLPLSFMHGPNSTLKGVVIWWNSHWKTSNKETQRAPPNDINGPTQSLSVVGYNGTDNTRVHDIPTVWWIKMKEKWELINEGNERSTANPSAEFEERSRQTLVSLAPVRCLSKHSWIGRQRLTRVFRLSRSIDLSVSINCLMCLFYLFLCTASLQNFIWDCELTLI